MIQLAGLDVLGQYHSFTSRMKDRFAEWSANIWTTHQGSATTAERAAVWQQLIDNTKVEWIERDTAGRLVAHPFPEDGSLPDNRR